MIPNGTDINHLAFLGTIFDENLKIGDAIKLIDSHQKNVQIRIEKAEEIQYRFSNPCRNCGWQPVHELAGIFHCTGKVVNHCHPEHISKFPTRQKGISVNCLQCNRDRSKVAPKTAWEGKEDTCNTIKGVPGCGERWWDDGENRHCRRCHEMLPIEAFYYRPNNKNNRFGHTATCKQCTNEQQGIVTHQRRAAEGKPTFTRRQKAEMQNWICPLCGDVMPDEPGAIHYDHIIPIAKGGTSWDDNMQATHAFCNESKGSK